jgi:hypothetical protein
LWLDAGRVLAEGSSAALVRDYLASGLTSTAQPSPTLTSDVVTVDDVRVDSPGQRAGDILHVGDPLHLVVDFDVAVETAGMDMSIIVSSMRGIRVFDQALRDHGGTRIPRGPHRAELDIPGILSAGDYVVGLWLGTQYETFVEDLALRKFTLHGTEDESRAGRVLVLDSAIAIHERPVPSLDNDLPTVQTSGSL